MSLSADVGFRGIESQDSDTARTALTAFDSLPNSQSSSFNGSITSQPSIMRPNSASDLGPVRVDTHHGPVTPSTSLSNRSSQEQALDLIQTNHDGDLLVSKETNLQGIPRLSVVPNARSTQLPAASRNYTSAPKRMANGEVKTTSESLPISPSESTVYSHSRNSSSTSRNSHIGELSSQLRTRLSYAMVKVQHGWQGHNLNELEHMTSQQNSPVSASSDKRQVYTPSMTMGSPLEEPTSAHFRQQHSTAVPQQYMTTSPASPQRRVATEAHNYLAGSAAPIPAGTYEAFWREHSGSAVQRPNQVPIAQMAGPSLAPPVDIHSRNPRRGESAKGPPPQIQTHNSDNMKSLPSTPTSKPLIKMRTPSQQAAVEKDAVETLLFMSSPGNSGYHPPGPLPGTPLRERVIHEEYTPSQRTAHGARFGAATSIPNASTRSPQRKALFGSDIDKMLDEMGESSSSEDEGLVHRRSGTQVQGIS